MIQCQLVPISHPQPVLSFLCHHAIGIFWILREDPLLSLTGQPNRKRPHHCMGDVKSFNCSFTKRTLFAMKMEDLGPGSLHYDEWRWINGTCIFFYYVGKRGEGKGVGMPGVQHNYCQSLSLYKIFKISTLWALSLFSNEKNFYLHLPWRGFLSFCVLTGRVNYPHFSLLSKTKWKCFVWSLH